MTKVLITGITGLIGKDLMHKLLETGDYQIRGQYFSNRNTDAYTSRGIEMRQADICDAGALKGICDGCEIVVHSAARVIDHGTKEDFYLAHYDATRFMLEEAKASSVRHFIYISSFGPATYIDRSNGLPDETVPLVKSGVHYDDAKIDAENLVKSFCPSNNMYYTIIRPAAVIGPDSIWVREPIKRAKTKFGLKLIDNGVKDACLVDVRNLSEGIYKTMTLPVARNQTYFFMDEYGVTWKQYMTELLAMVGEKPKGSVSRPVALLLAKVMGVLFPLWGAQPPIGVKSVIATSSDRRVIVRKARTELGWQSRVSYREAMEKIRRSLEHS